jgi:hypothetical protein
MNITTHEWKEFIINGLGGFLLFLAAGYVAVIDILSYFNGRPLLTYYSKMSADNDLGISLTLSLTIVSILGLMSFIYQVHCLHRKLRKD